MNRKDFFLNIFQGILITPFLKIKDSSKNVIKTTKNYIKGTFHGSINKSKFKVTKYKNGICTISLDNSSPFFKRETIKEIIENKNNLQKV